MAAKFYPSTEDLLSVKKIRIHGDTIKLSIIYTPIGIWILKSNRENYPENHSTFFENGSLYNFTKQCVDNFYYDSETYPE